MTEVIANFTISWNKEVAIDAINQTGKIPAEVKPAINDAIEAFNDAGLSTIQQLEGYSWPDAIADWGPTIIEVIRAAF